MVMAPNGESFMNDRDAGSPTDLILRGKALMERGRMMARGEHRHSPQFYPWLTSAQSWTPSAWNPPAPDGVLVRRLLSAPPPAR